MTAAVATPVCMFLWGSKSLEHYQGLKPGEELPKASLVSLRGEAISTEEWRGNPTLLVLFQSACSACREEIINLSAMSPSVPRLRIVLLSVDDAVPPFEVPFPVYLDPSKSLLKKARRLLVPTLYWIDENGRVEYARSGRLTEDQLQSLFEMLLPETG